MASYVLLPMRKWSGLNEWSPFQLGERTRWKATLQVSLLDPSVGSSITVDLQVSPTGDSEDWTLLKTFGAKTAVGQTVLDATVKENPDFTLTPRQNIWIRAVISAITGEVAAEVLFECPFLDVYADDDLSLLSQDLRNWTDGFSRVMLEAEADIAQMLSRNSETGELDIDLSRPEVHKLIKLEVADQAEHLKRIAILSQSHDPSAMVSLRSMPRLYPSAGVRLRRYRTESSLVWRGR